MVQVLPFFSDQFSLGSEFWVALENVHDVLVLASPAVRLVLAFPVGNPGLVLSPHRLQEVGGDVHGTVELLGGVGTDFETHRLACIPIPGQEDFRPCVVLDVEDVAAFGPDEPALGAILRVGFENLDHILELLLDPARGRPSLGGARFALALALGFALDFAPLVRNPLRVLLLDCCQKLPAQLCCQAYGLPVVPADLESNWVLGAAFAPKIDSRVGLILDMVKVRAFDPDESALDAEYVLELTTLNDILQRTAFAALIHALAAALLAAMVVPLSVVPVVILLLVIAIVVVPALPLLAIAILAVVMALPAVASIFVLVLAVGILTLFIAVLSREHVVDTLKEFFGELCGLVAALTGRGTYLEFQWSVLAAHHAHLRARLRLDVPDVLTVISEDRRLQLECRLAVPNGQTLDELGVGFFRACLRRRCNLDSSCRWWW
mmetsp:Transcript_3118/g.8008  ORF Transcript_3118/g.8008 Transcript_3118/m.8008 type:complete len:435 (+) Transcript_3118:761-2065(+)